MQMDSFEATRVVHEKIEQLEPKLATKIIGYLYLQENPQQELIRLAFGPENLIHDLVQKAKAVLGLNPRPIIPPDMINNPNPLSSPSSFHGIPTYWDPHHAPSKQHPIHSTPPSVKLMPYSDPEYSPKNPFVEYGFSSNDYYGPEAGFSNLSVRSGRNHVMDYPPVKSCHYFKKGLCKHGSNCRFFHGASFPESYSQNQMFGPNSYEDQFVSPGSLERLEMEVTELLKSRRGNPVSIASLPMMYYEKYGKTLQAEGYLTESQRHGKAGYSLTKLLARLKNSIRLIDRPHGQHAVVLAEDAVKYMDIRGERNDPGPIVSGSRQIYLTFPAESTFTEEDVSNYFSTFGPVQDVRIPCQQKRMFGFVTFASADTVKTILSKGSPHNVCGARVLVKPYREKPKLPERRFHEKFGHPMLYLSNSIDTDPEFQARSDSDRLFRRQLMEEHEKALELETRRLRQLRLSPKPLDNRSCLEYSVDESKVPRDQLRFRSTEHYNYLFDVLNSGSNTDDNTKYSMNNCGDQESGQGLNLPDSPFSSVVASSISAVM